MHTVNIIAIGYAKKTLEPGTRDYVRVRSYAECFRQYHQIVFTKKGEYQTLATDGPLQLHATNSLGKPFMLWDAYRVAQSLIDAAPREKWVVTAQDPFAASFVMLLLRGKYLSRQVQIHGDIFARRYFKRFLFTWPLRMWAGFVCKQVDGIRVVSKRIADSLIRRHIPASKITVLAIQPRLDRFLEVGAQRDYAATKPVTCIYVGRFTREKNLRLLMTAFAEACTADEQLVFVGDGPQRAALVRLAEKLHISNRVTFTPWTEDVAHELSRADVLCLSSDHEGYALVLLEAMAAGMPVITTAVGCAGEVVLDGMHGIVVPVRAKKQYSEALKQLSTQPQFREQCGRRGYKTATQLIIPDRTYIETLCKTLSQLTR